MARGIALVRSILEKVPGQKLLGPYRFLPFFFVLGGAMEWFMINVRAGEETFYDVFRRKQAERRYQERLEQGFAVQTEEVRR